VECGRQRNRLLDGAQHDLSLVGQAIGFTRLKEKKRK
jgi:hypothetical protein